MTARKTTLIGIAIVGFWLVTMAALFQREVLPGLLPGATITAALNPIDEWFGVFINDDARVGVLHLASQPATRDGHNGTEIHADARLNLALLEYDSELNGAASAWIPQDRNHIEFSASLSGGEQRMEIHGTIHDGLLDAAIATADTSFPIQWPVGDLGITAGMFSGTPFQTMKPGEIAFVPAFDPMSMEMRNATVKCLRHDTFTDGETAERVTVYQTTLNSITSEIWLDADGQTVQVKTPYGFTLRRMNAGDAAAPLAPGAVRDLLSLVAIRPSGQRPFRGASKMTVRLSGYDEAAGLPTDATQRRLDNGSITIIPPAAPASNPVITLDAALLDDALASDPLIQSSHPDMVAQAQAIVGDAAGAWDRSLKIYEWVYQNIEKIPVPTVPSALEVLKTRQGDCNEHTVLFTALARAIGIPTHVAIGVVWSEELDAFYYHAWPEVFAGAWIPMDPTLGQTVADATHLKLVEGDIQQWPRLAAFLGRMRIEIVEIH